MPNTAAHSALRLLVVDARLLRRVMRKPFDLDELVGEVLSCGLSVEQHAH